MLGFLTWGGVAGLDFLLLQWTYSDKWRLLDEERVDHSGVSNENFCVSFRFYTILRVLASFFIEGDYGSVVNWWDHFPLQ